MQFLVKLYRKFFPREELLGGSLHYCDECSRIGILGKSIKKWKATVKDDQDNITFIDIYLCRRHSHEQLFY